MKYYKRKFEEIRGDEYNDWGFATYFFETDNEGFPLRHIEAYENGKILKYSKENDADEFGFLADQQLDISDFKDFEITEEEFLENWN